MSNYKTETTVYEAGNNPSPVTWGTGFRSISGARCALTSAHKKGRLTDGAVYVIARLHGSDSYDIFVK